ncbi:MAG: 2-oxo acid dehydrogenase subunit E2 [Desulfurococcales archaeon]|nr:2-oxo acid dehydrogenase subunit E2 [Desulfurococcales archaeon]
MGRVIQVKLPDLGEGLAEAEIVEWLVKEGDRIKQFQPMVKVLTAKATMEIPSPYTGRVVKLLAKPGDVVQVGQPFVEIEVEEEAPVPAREEKPEAKPSEAKEAPARAEARLEAVAVRRPRRLIRAPPRVRKLARQLGVKLEEIEGTGPRGAITEEDVRRAAEKLKAPPPPQPQPPAVKVEAVEEERVPLRGIKRIMAKTMSESKSRIPHAYLAEEVDLTELFRLRESLRREAESKGVRLTILPFILKAVARALKKYPLMNSELDEERMEIVVKKRVNLGIAVDTPHGLVVPVIKDVDRKGLFRIARDLEELASKAREMKLSTDDVTGATFTVTNVGSIGSVLGFPVIYPPNVAILGIHRAVEKPVFVEGELKPRRLAYISLSFDHRVIEGGYAARFLVEVKRMLENPALIFASEEEFE